MSLIELFHDRSVLKRRIRVISGHIAPLLPRDARVLDVGCGSGEIDQLILAQRPDVTLEGIDVLVREGTPIPVKEYDGHTLPYPDKTFDIVMFVDVLHHTDNIEGLLAEADRVARHGIVIKDHTMDGWLANSRLSFMDRVGNCRFGVRLPYAYWPKSRWEQAFEKLRLKPAVWTPSLRLYRWPLSPFFDSTLHFIALLQSKAKEPTSGSPPAAS